MRCLIPVFFLLVGCHLPQKNTLCRLEGKIVLSGQLDGCNWLIQTSDGRMLLPQNAADFTLSDQQMISFSYIPFEGMSTCMAEDEIIILTCLHARTAADCPTFSDWQEVPWIHSLVDSKAVKMIVRYTFGQTYLYLVTTSDGKAVWYNCRGQQICNQDEGCDLPGNKVKEPITIFLAQR